MWSGLLGIPGRQQSCLLPLGVFLVIEDLSIAAGGPYSPYSPASPCIPASLGCEQQANGRKMKIDFTLKLIWFLLLGPFNLCSLNKS